MGGSATAAPRLLSPMLPKEEALWCMWASVKSPLQSQSSLARELPSSQHHWSGGNGPICEHLIAERGSHLQTTNKIKVANLKNA